MRIQIMRKLVLILSILLLGNVLIAQDSIKVALAEWTFDNWYGGGVLPSGQTETTPVPADRGILAETALLGTEQMFSGGTVTRRWSVPTTGGYVRCATGWSAGSGDRFYLITGLNTLGASSVQLSSSHATSSSSQVYSLKVQYRIGSNGEWKDLFGPFAVTDVTESGISRRQVNNVRLPGECNNVPHIDIRWLCAQFPSSASTQFRIDNIFLTANAVNPDPDADKTPLVLAQTLQESDWAIPSWTLFLSAQKKASTVPITENLVELHELMDNMLPKEMPYNINASFNGDPATNMAFAWYTNSGISGGLVQIVAKENATTDDFANPLITLEASTTNLSNVNYVVTANDPVSTADIPVNSKRSYVSNKALATALTPNTKYSYRVGNPDAWSSIRSFRTAKNTKDDFSFIYITDTQANSNDNFKVSANTLSEAYKKAEEPLFVLMTGDLVESQGSSNSEWEFEQFFERMDNVWDKLPIVATIGNHDASSSNNFFNHINNDVSYNKTAKVKSTYDGTVYSFVVGDALFMIVNHEDRTKVGFAESLGKWMTEQVNAHPNVRWRIVGVHTGLFSGGSHQNNETIASFRDEMLPYYNNLKIDMSFQGHDHMYNVIGPVNNSNKSVVPGSVHDVGTAPVVVQSNMNGKTGGIFDVTHGTLYFINNSASRKKYSPKTQSSMNSSSSVTKIPDYWSLFTGRYGQTGEPTFSDVKVTRDTIFISTYAINNAGDTYLFDEIKVTKQLITGIGQVIKEKVRIALDYKNNLIKVHGVDAHRIDLYDIQGQLIKTKRGTDQMTLSSMKNGVYFVRIYSQDGIINEKILYRNLY